MNFTTDLPKGAPVVSYIVASAIKCLKFFPDSENEGPAFRMHAVILKQPQKRAQNSLFDMQHAFSNLEGGALREQESYVLCHIRKTTLGIDSPERALQPEWADDEKGVSDELKSAKSFVQ